MTAWMRWMTPEEIAAEERRDQTILEYLAALRRRCHRLEREALAAPAPRHHGGRAEW